MSADNSATSRYTDPRTVLRPEVFEQVTARITRDHPLLDPAFAKRITGQTVAFLVASVLSGARLFPSPAVSIGWHAFILHTREYTRFCLTLAGRYIHHGPRGLLPNEGSQAQAARARTITAIRAARYRVDEELWPQIADCPQCRVGCQAGPALRP